MLVEETTLPGVKIVTPRRFSDRRGFFSESWNRRTFETSGLNLPEFVQDNHSLSREKGTVRGLHFQAARHAQGKLVRCGRGSLFDVAVDARKDSPTYGRWFGEVLSFDNGKQLWIPAGFLHGFMTFEDDVEIIYKCTGFYTPESDGAVLWNSCGIKWRYTDFKLTISDRDANAQTLASFESPFN